MKSKKIQYILIVLIFLLSTQKAADAQVGMQIVKGTPGYFRVGKTNEGQWWLIDPANKPFYYRGVCAVNRAGTAGGRRAKPGLYATAIDKKYDYQTSPDKFVEASIQKLHDAGFNALGAWATEEFFNRGIPYTEILEFFKEPPFLPSVTDKVGLPDIFHPEWEIAIDKKARSICSPLRTSKELVGYFTDNEIGFGKADDLGLDLGFQAGQFDFALLRLVLGMKPDEPASEFAWNYLLSRHDNSFDKLSKAWQVKISNKEEIKKLNDSKVSITAKAFLDDAQTFVEIYAERYFELAYKAIKRYDPNHLILGCRFGAPPPNFVLDAIKPFADVISVNNYQPTLYERYDTVYQYTGLPLIIGEFSWNTDLYKKVPLTSESDKQLKVNERMFIRGKKTIERIALHNGIVGYTWYRWVQGTCTDEKFYDGIVNYGDSLEMHVPVLSIVNRELENIRLSAANGTWKNAPLQNGEITLFMDQMRPNWNQFLRADFRNGKPIETIYGWKMKGKILKFSTKNNAISFRLEVDFVDELAVNKAYEGGKGIYNITMGRAGEKFYGKFTGTYNGKVVSGIVKAFYFPETYLNSK